MYVHMYTRMYICIYIHVLIYAHMYIYIHTYIHTHIHLYTFLQAGRGERGEGLIMGESYVYTYSHTFVYIHTGGAWGGRGEDLLFGGRRIHVYIYMHICTYLYIYVHRCAHMYICICIYTESCIHLYVYRYEGHGEGEEGKYDGRKSHTHIIYIHIYTHPRIHLYVYTQEGRIYTYIYTYLHTFIYIHTGGRRGREVSWGERVAVLKVISAVRWAVLAVSSGLHGAGDVMVLQQRAILVAFDSLPLQPCDKIYPAAEVCCLFCVKYIYIHRYLHSFVYKTNISLYINILTYVCIQDSP